MLFIEDGAPVIVQGMTGHQGMTHTARMLKAGTNIVGGVNPRKAGTSVTFPGARTVPTRTSPCSPPAAKHVKPPAPRPAWCSCRRSSPSPPWSKPSKPASNSSWSSLKAFRWPIPHTSSNWRSRRACASSDRTALAHHARQPRRQSGHHPRRHRRPRPARTGLQIRHPHLPAHGRIVRYRLHRMSRRRGDPIVGTTLLEALQAFEADPDTKLS